MTAPRATLLMYGAEDQYGLRAALQKPHLYDEIRPIFRLYGKEDNLAFYENVDPGTHNYELDNREHAYAFFTKHFNIPVVEHEVPVDAEVKSFLELLVGLPKDNLSITGLARKIASGFQRPEVPSEPSSKAKWASASRSRLKEVVRFKPVTIWHAWPLFSTRNKGLRSIGYRLEFDNELSATAIWLKSTTCADNAPLSILLDDSGLRSVQMDILTDPVRLTTELTSPDNAIPWHINRGEQVLAVNLIFTGDASPDFPKNEPVHVPELYQPTLGHTRANPRRQELVSHKTTFRTLWIAVVCSREIVRSAWKRRSSWELQTGCETTMVSKAFLLKPRGFATRSQRSLRRRWSRRIFLHFPRVEV